MLKKGDSVFFGASSAASAGFSGTALQVINSLGLVPYTYAGLKTAGTRGSNAGWEARRDLHQSQVWILLLTVDDAVARADHWATHEMTNRGDRILLVYALGSISTDEIAQLALPVNAISVSDEQQFASDLKQQLEKLMALR